MGTRATYRFIKQSTLIGTSVTIYKHYDGYPEGGIAFIDQAIERAVNASNKAHTLMDRVVIEFLNNDKTNMFSNRDAHLDTEYHYDIMFYENSNIEIKMLKRDGEFWKQQKSIDSKIDELHEKCVNYIVDELAERSLDELAERFPKWASR